MFQRYCTCAECSLHAGSTRGKKWTHKMEWYNHQASIERARHGQQQPPASPPPPRPRVAQSLEERSDDLFLATAAGEYRDPRHVVLISRSTIQQSRPFYLPGACISAMFSRASRPFEQRFPPSVSKRKSVKHTIPPQWLPPSSLAWRRTFRISPSVWCGHRKRFCPVQSVIVLNSWVYFGRLDGPPNLLIRVRRRYGRC
ncbi:hypothetical protein OH77DRAFT_118116 [Trametes cingulata]|nr:hypothetical protein OH77DRAFT_118116 [Trametes cingulata]